jgi:hypothetical protein
MIEKQLSQLGRSQQYWVRSNDSAAKAYHFLGARKVASIPLSS